MKEIVNQVLVNIPLPFGWEVLVVTPLKIVGFIGALMFGGRWVIQGIASRIAKKPVMPIVFWYMSLIGSCQLLLYFVFGKNDSIGIIQNFPAVFVAVYNIFLEYKHRGSKNSPGENAPS